MSTRPKWWWQGVGSISDDEIVREIQAMADAGFSGAVLGLEAPSQDIRNKLGVALRAGAARNFQIDQKLGQGWPISTPNTGDDDNSPHHQFELVYGVLNIVGPAPYIGPLPPPRGVPQPGPQLGTAFTVPPKFIAAVAGRVIEEGVPVVYPAPGVLYQPFAAGQPIAPTAPGISTILDPASLTDVTAQVVSNVFVTFIPPDAGHWVLFAFYQRPTLEATMDHLSGDAVRAAAEYFDENQIGAENVAHMRPGSEFFEDSLELTFSGIPWTGALRQTFNELWGYDVTPYLPLLYIQNEYQTPGYDPAHMPNPDYDLPDSLGARVRYDFRQTLNHLYIHEHLAPFQEWAEKYGMHFSSQVAYGSPFDQVRAARELNSMGGVAEVEARNAGDPVGRSSTIWRFGLDQYRATASGAHQAGKNRIATEIAANNARGFLMSLSEYKAMMDKQWAAGISNQNVVIFTSAAPDSAWPGPNGAAGVVLAQAWNDVHFPEWPLWRRLTDYWARGNYLLQSGQAQVDVVIYRDAPTTFAATAGGIALDFIHNLIDPQLPTPVFTDAQGGHPIGDATGLATPSPFFDAQPLESKGYTIEYIDPAGLLDPRSAGEGVLYPAGPSYQALVIDQRSMPGDAAQALAQAVERGLAVVIVGAPPSMGKSFARVQAEDAQVVESFERIMASPRTRIVDTQADVAEALASIGVRPRAEFMQPVAVYSQARRIGNIDVWFLWNADSVPVAFTASFATSGAPHALDLWTGMTEPLAKYRVTNDRVELPIALRAGETMALAFDQGNPAARRRHVVATDAELVLHGRSGFVIRDTRSGIRTVELDNRQRRTATLPEPGAPIALDTWHLQVHTSEPTPRTLELDLTELDDWRNISELAKVSGTGIYTTTFEIPTAWTNEGRGAYLDLGQFCGAIEIYINDEAVPAPATSDTAYSLPLPAVPRVTRLVDVADFVRPGPNTLRVVLATTIQNAAKAEIEKGSTATASSTLGPSQPYGLLGPVRLLPYAEATVR